MKLWSDSPPALAPVDKAWLPTKSAHSANPLPERFRGIIPGLHTLYVLRTKGFR
jgi:hypothetical protein